MEDYIPINFGLITHPANWLIIVLMVWIFLIFAHEVAKLTVETHPDMQA